LLALSDDQAPFDDSDAVGVTGACADGVFANVIGGAGGADGVGRRVGRRVGRLFGLDLGGRCVGHGGPEQGFGAPTRVGDRSRHALAHDRRAERHRDLSETARRRDVLLDLFVATVDLGAPARDEHVDEGGRGVLQEQAEAERRVEQHLQRPFDPVVVLGHGVTVDSRSSAGIVTSGSGVVSPAGAASGSGSTRESRDAARR
jgi:hypothetical protein